MSCVLCLVSCVLCLVSCVLCVALRCCYRVWGTLQFTFYATAGLSLLFSDAMLHLCWWWPYKQRWNMWQSEYQLPWFVVVLLSTCGNSSLRTWCAYMYHTDFLYWKYCFFFVVVIVVVVVVVVVVVQDIEASPVWADTQVCGKKSSQAALKKVTGKEEIYNTIRRDTSHHETDENNTTRHSMTHYTAPRNKHNATQSRNAMKYSVIRTIHHQFVFSHFVQDRVCSREVANQLARILHVQLP